MQLSIIIPLYNSAATITRAIDSLRTQVCQDYEIIVINDGSSDGGPQIVSELARNDRRIRLISQPNGGVSSARNRGLDEAQGSFVLFLDADDWMLPQGVDALLVAARTGGTGAAVGKFEMIGPRNTLLSVEGPWSDEITHNHLLGGIFMTIHGHIVERRFYDTLRFDPHLALIEDTDLWLKLAERGVRWRNCHQTVCGYLMREDSRSVDFPAMLECAIRVYQSAYQRARAAASAGLDTSESRLNALLANAAAGYATRLAISREGATAAALELFNRAPGNRQIDAQRLARHARHAVMFALGDRPGAPDSAAPPIWWTRLERWWAALESHHAITDGTAATTAAYFNDPPQPVRRSA